MAAPSALRSAAALLIASPLALLAFGSNEACKKAETFDVEPPIVIGASVDLTKQKDFGAGVQRVLRVAEQQLNAVGGVLGRRVVIDVKDDAGGSDLIGGIAKDFIARGVAGFVGPSTSDALLRIHGDFRAAKIPILSPLTTAPFVRTLQTGRDRYVFRTSCAVEPQARAIARYAIGHSFAPPGAPTDAGAVDSGASDASADGGAADASAPPPGSFKACKRMAAIYAEEGGTTIDALRTDYKRFGGELVDFQIQAGAASYAADVAKVVAAARAGQVDCQTMLMFPADGGKYMREFRAATAGDPALSIDAFPSYGFIRFYQAGFIEAGRIDAKNPNEISAAEGVMGAACNQERLTSPEWTRFKALYDGQFPAVIDAGSLPPPIPQVYDSVILLALAIERAGSLDDRVAIRDALFETSAPPGDAYGPGQLAEALDAVRQGRDIDYAGAAGTFDLDDEGDTALEVIMWRVTGNSFVTVPGLRSADLLK